MLLKDGYQTCPRCQGNGCYRCNRKGYLLVCPTCANSEIEFFRKGDDGFRCIVCGTIFSKGGNILTQAD